MSLTYNNSELTAALKGWIESVESDFTGRIPEIIELGELRLLRDLDIDIFDTTSSVNTADGTETLAKPAGMVSERSMHYTASGVIVQILPRSYDYVRDYGGSGNPKYYAQLDEDNWLLAPVPASVIPVTVRYIKRPDGLADVSEGETTWLSANVPDALLYACLASCEAFIKDDARVKLWQAEYVKMLAAAKSEVKRLMRAKYGR